MDKPGQPRLESGNLPHLSPFRASNQQVPGGEGGGDGGGDEGGGGGVSQETRKESLGLALASKALWLPL